MDTVYILVIILLILCIFLLIIETIYNTITERQLLKKKRLNYNTYLDSLWDALISDINNIEYVEHYRNTYHFNYADRYSVIVFDADSVNRTCALFDKDETTCIISNYKLDKSRKLANELMFRIKIF